MEDTIAPQAKKPAARKTAKAPTKPVKPAKKVKPAAKKTVAGKTTVKAAPKPKKPAAQNSILPIILKELDQDKGQDIVSIDLGGKSSIADHLVIATGTSSRHVTSMAKKLCDRLAKEGVKARMEGQQTGDWVIVDAIDVIVHVFRPEVRSFYNLEKLWGADFSTMDYTLYKSV